MKLSTQSIYPVLAACLLLPLVSPHCLAQAQNRTGFFYPAGTSRQGNYEGWLTPNKAFGGFHLARDYQKNVGDPIVAICDGEVIQSDPNVGSFGGDRKPGGAVVVQHYAQEGNRRVVFYALYGHLTDLIPNHTHVVAGQTVIGRVGHYYSINYGDIPHLHFGIHPYSEAADPDQGYTKDRNRLDGWVDPNEWMDSHSPINNQANNPSPPSNPSQNQSNGDLNCYMIGHGNFLIELFQAGAPFPSRQTGPVKSSLMYRAEWNNLVRSQHYFVRVTNKDNNRARQTQSFLLDPDKDRCVIMVNWDKSGFVMQSDALRFDR